eukprot:295840-Amphidinium_carterae.1
MRDGGQVIPSAQDDGCQEPCLQHIEEAALVVSIGGRGPDPVLRPVKQSVQGARCPAPNCFGADLPILGLAQP